MTGQSAPFIPPLPNPPLEVIAVKRFFADYVIPSNQNVPWLNFLRALPDLYGVSKPGSCLVASVLAASYANIAGRLDSSSLRSKAVRQYGFALRSLKEALRTPEEACRNETILVTVLLGLYEVMMNKDASYNGMEKHLHGAVSLVKLRGQTLLETELGRQLYVQITYQSVSSSTAYCCCPN